MDRKGQAGQTIPLLALFMTVLLGGTGFVVDVGGAWGQARTEQKVADAAALAGATAESNGALKTAIINAAKASAVANGYAANEVTVNIPPTSGAYRPGGSASGSLSTNDCSTAALVPCWVEVVISRPHQNSFASILGSSSWQVSERGVAVGGIANAVSNGIAPLMFNFRSVQASDNGTDKQFCEPQKQQCPPQDGPWPTVVGQFTWTTFCTHGSNCNVTPPETVAIINGGNIQLTVYIGMALGPHNNGNPKKACEALVAKYPLGADLSVAINDDNGDLIGFWVWHFDPTNTDCSGGAHAYIGGWFVQNITTSLPLTINANGSAATFGQYVVRLVE